MSCLGCRCPRCCPGRATLSVAVVRSANPREESNDNNEAYCDVIPEPLERYMTISHTLLLTLWIPSKGTLLHTDARSGGFVPPPSIELLLHSIGGFRSSKWQSPGPSSSCGIGPTRGLLLDKKPGVHGRTSGQGSGQVPDSSSSSPPSSPLEVYVANHRQLPRFYESKECNGLVGAHLRIRTKRHNKVKLG